MIKKIIEVIKSSKGLLIAGHTNPDGDAMGAMIGMAHLCEYLKVPYTVVLEKVPETFKALTLGVHTSEQIDRDYDTFITVDCGDSKRLGVYEEAFYKASSSINIDHHVTNAHFATYNYVVAEGSSTSELVFRVMEACGCMITEAIAKAIYTGILTDTGGFMYTCTKPSTHDVAAKLLEVPFDFTNLYYEMIHEKTEKEVLMQSVAALRLEKIGEGNIFITYVTAEDLEQYQASKEDLGTVITYIKNIRGCEVAAFIYPSSEESYKVSLRGDEPYDVAKLAGELGGGGHARAAGATVVGSLDEVIKRLKMLLVP